MQHLKALIFDVDGTLADTERDGHLVAFNMAFQDAGLDWTWSDELYVQLLGVTGGKERIYHYISTHRPDLNLRSDLNGFIARLHKRKTEFYVDLLSRGSIPLRPGVERLIRAAKETGLKLAIATTTTPGNVTALLDNTLGIGAENWFDVIAAGEAVSAKKPAPDIYNLAMKDLGLAPEGCLALEDSVNGLRSALDSGIKSVVITINDYTQHETFTGASLVLNQFGEPEAPCQVLQGPLLDPAWLTVPYLMQLHERVWA